MRAKWWQEGTFLFGMIVGSLLPIPGTAGWLRDFQEKVSEFAQDYDASPKLLISRSSPLGEALLSQSSVTLFSLSETYPEQVQVRLISSSTSNEDLLSVQTSPFLPPSLASNPFLFEGVDHEVFQVALHGESSSIDQRQLLALSQPLPSIQLSEEALLSWISSKHRGLIGRLEIADTHLRTQGVDPLLLEGRLFVTSNQQAFLLTKAPPSLESQRGLFGLHPGGLSGILPCSYQAFTSPQSRGDLQITGELKLLSSVRISLPPSNLKEIAIYGELLSVERDNEGSYLMVSPSQWKSLWAQWGTPMDSFGKTEEHAQWLRVLPRSPDAETSSWLSLVLEDPILSFPSLPGVSIGSSVLLSELHPEPLLITAAGVQIPRHLTPQLKPQSSWTAYLSSSEDSLPTPLTYQNFDPNSAGTFVLASTIAVPLILEDSLTSEGTLSIRSSTYAASHQQTRIDSSLWKRWQSAGPILGTYVDSNGKAEPMILSRSSQKFPWGTWQSAPTLSLPVTVAHTEKDSIHLDGVASKLSSEGISLSLDTWKRWKQSGTPTGWLGSDTKTAITFEKPSRRYPFGRIVEAAEVPIAVELEASSIQFAVGGILPIQNGSIQIDPKTWNLWKSHSPGYGLTERGVPVAYDGSVGAFGSIALQPTCWFNVLNSQAEGIPTPLTCLSSNGIAMQPLSATPTRLELSTAHWSLIQSSIELLGTDDAEVFSLRMVPSLSSTSLGILVSRPVTQVPISVIGIPDQVLLSFSDGSNYEVRNQKILISLAVWKAWKLSPPTGQDSQSKFQVAFSAPRGALGSVLGHPIVKTPEPSKKELVSSPSPLIEGQKSLSRLEAACFQLFQHPSALSLTSFVRQSDTSEPSSSAISPCPLSHLLGSKHGNL